MWAGGHLNEMYVRDVKCDREEEISRLALLCLKGI
jgi:hypothetical protein